MKNTRFGSIQMDYLVVKVGNPFLYVTIPLDRTSYLCNKTKIYRW